MCAYQHAEAGALPAEKPTCCFSDTRALQRGRSHVLLAVCCLLPCRLPAQWIHISSRHCEIFFDEAQARASGCRSALPGRRCISASWVCRRGFLPLHPTAACPPLQTTYAMHLSSFLCAGQLDGEGPEHQRHVCQQQPRRARQDGACQARGPGALLLLLPGRGVASVCSLALALRSSVLPAGLHIPHSCRPACLPMPAPSCSNGVAKGFAGSPIAAGSKTDKPITQAKVPKIGCLQLNGLPAVPAVLLAQVQMSVNDPKAPNNHME